MASFAAGSKHFFRIPIDYEFGDFAYEKLGRNFGGIFPKALEPTLSSPTML